MAFQATTGLGVAAKILVVGNNFDGPAGKETVPGYNDVVLSISGDNGPTTFQLNPQVVDVANNPVEFGTSYALTAVAASSGPGQLAVSAVAASSGGEAVYTVSSGGSTNEWVGYSFVVAGFNLPVNNGTFICTASTSTSLTLENPFAVAETESATATSAEGVAVYTGTIVETASSLIGKTFVVAGFTDANNNGTFIATANNGSTTVTLANPAATAQSGQTATAVTQEGQWVDAATAIAAGTGVITGTFPEFASFPIGDLVTVSGFSNAANNGTFTLVAATSDTSITVSNYNSVAQSGQTATVVIGSYDDLTYVAYGFQSSLPNTYLPNLDSNVAVVTVSDSGLITAGTVEGGSVVEVSFPTFSNASGDTGAVSPNPMTGLPLNKIYAEVNVTVVA